jgi:hypothetical protein
VNPSRDFGDHTFAANSVGCGSLTMGRAAKVTIERRHSSAVLSSDDHGGGAVYKSHDRGIMGPQPTRASRTSWCSRSAMDPNEPSLLYRAFGSVRAGDAAIDAGR